MQRLAPLERHLDGPGDLLADHHAHAAADERVLHRRDDDVEAVEPAGGDDDRVLEAGGCDGRAAAGRGRAWCR